MEINTTITHQKKKIHIYKYISNVRSKWKYKYHIDTDAFKFSSSHGLKGKNPRVDWRRGNARGTCTRKLNIVCQIRSYFRQLKICSIKGNKKQAWLLITSIGIGFLLFYSDHCSVHCFSG